MNPIGSNDENRSAAPMMPCDGWWEQRGFGRQPMHQLQLSFAGGMIRGAGVDIVGPFLFDGTLSHGGDVAMVKKYVGKHRVNYVGKYDGEGLMWGMWNIGPFKGPWAIRLQPGGEMAADEVGGLTSE
jgi:hypothetical protein